MLTVNPLINAPLLFNASLLLTPLPKEEQGNKEKTKDLKNRLEYWRYSSDIEDSNVCFNLLDEDAEDDDFVDVV